ncbi:MAG: hypothetical protein KDC87_11905 [Planctomycetes bacterium]|nr:hypothetical protein [Planctomycetota bacterium]MCB9870378.1 hypothetical protein [Planctomycetota bacterium]
MIDRVLTPLRGNPILGRHLATTFTGMRLGFAFLLLTGAMVGVYGVLFAAISHNASTPPGVVYVAHNAVLFAALLLLLPLKLSGLIEGPRVNRAFDQIVVTGVGPPVLFIGAWVSGLAYAALLLFVTVPFAACMVTFGGVGVGQMLIGYVTLFAYCFVIIAATLGASVFGREWFTVPVVVAVLGTLAVFAFVPDRWWVNSYPSALAELTPVRLLLAQAGQEPSFHPALGASPPVLLLYKIPVGLYRVLAWGTVVLASAVLFHVGPGHVFSPGLDIFGTVVRRGDRKRGLLGRLRGGLTRRVEMAFFYENAPAWTQRFGVPIRLGMVTLLVPLAWAVMIGGLYRSGAAAGREHVFSDDTMSVCMWFGASILALWCLLNVGSRHAAHSTLQIGRWRPTREVVTWIVFALLLHALTWMEHETIREIVSTGATRRGAKLTASGVTNYAASWWQLLAATLLMVFNVFLITRIATAVSANWFWASGLSLLGLVLLLGVPAIVAVSVREEVISPEFERLAYLTPACLYEQVPFRVLIHPSEVNWGQFALSHSVLAGGLTVLYVLVSVLRRGSRRGGSPGAAAAAILVCCGLATDGRAQDPEPQRGDAPIEVISAARGFGGSVCVHGVDFVNAVVRNPGSSRIDVEYWIEEQPDVPITERRQFVLTPGATRHVHWPRSGNARSTFGRTQRLAFRVGTRVVRSEPLMLRELTAWLRRTNKGRRAEQFLFVGERGGFPQKWLIKAHEESSANLLSCPPSDLPSDVASYEGVEVVWLRARSLTEMSTPQRAALQLYVRAGGSVVLYGGVAAEDLEGAGEWEKLIRPVRVTPAAFGGKQLVHVALDQGRDVLWPAGRSGDAGDTPALLNVRHIGAGSVAHCSFVPLPESLPLELRDSDAFWTRFDEALPRSAFPLINYGPDEWLLPDMSTLTLLGVFYLVYVVLLTGTLFVFARRRQQRARMWVLVAVLPLLFLGLVPGVIRAVRSVPSRGIYSEVVYAKAGSTEALVAAELEVVSAGRQEHRVRVAGVMPSAWAAVDSRRVFVWGGLGVGATLTGARQEPVRPVDRDAGFDVQCTTSPWSQSRMVMFDRATLDEAVEGHARQRKGKLDLEVRLPKSMRGREVFVLMRATGNSQWQRVDVRPDAQGVIRARSAVGGARMRGANRLPLHTRWNLTSWRSGPLVLVAVLPGREQPTRLVPRSEDLVFERGISARQAERSPDDLRRGTIRSTPSGFVKSLVEHVAVFEIPLR